MKYRNDITVERLQELLDYDPATGYFIWCVSRGSRAKAGQRAGHKNENGYVSVRLDGVLYQAHRLAWFYHYGVWPSADLDHKNRDRADNRISNLRPASRSENMRNSCGHKDSMTGLKGVTFVKATGWWVAQIKKSGKNIYLGRFTSSEEAHAAYAVAARRLFGEFARMS